MTDDIGSLRYNTAIAGLMAYLNTLQEREGLHDEEVSCLLLMLAPFAPYIAEELWAQLPEKPFSIHQQAFPVASPALLEVATVPVAVQINGRTRGLVHLAPQASQAEALAAAQGIPRGSGTRAWRAPARGLRTWPHSQSGRGPVSTMFHGTGGVCWTRFRDGRSDAYI